MLKRETETDRGKPLSPHCISVALTTRKLGGSLPALAVPPEVSRNWCWTVSAEKIIRKSFNVSLDPRKQKLIIKISLFTQKLLFVYEVAQHATTR